MIQLLPCPDCTKTTLLPEGLSTAAKIRCPHCGGEFVIDEMLAQQFGVWEVIEPGPSATSQISAAVPASDAQPTEVTAPVDAIRERELQLEAEEPTAAESQSSVLKKQADWSNYRPITHEQFERNKRKSRSPLWSVLQVVLGGVAAIPIGLLLVWHLIGTDVGGAGPFVGKYLPWIVPAKFRPYEQPGAQFTRGPTPERGRSGFRRFDDVLRDEFAGDELAKQDQDMAQTATADVAPDADAEPSPVAILPGMEPAVEVDTQSGTLAVDQPASLSEQNVFALIRQCEQDLDNWSQGMRAENADLRSLAQAVYSDLTDLAQAIAALPKGNPVLRILRDQMQPIGRTVKRQADVQQLITQGTRHWREIHAKAESYGLAMIVETETVQPQIAETQAADESTDMWVVVPAKPTTDSEQPLEINVPKYLAPALIPGQKLLLLGTVQVTESEVEAAPDVSTFTANYLHAL